MQRPGNSISEELSSLIFKPEVPRNLPPSYLVSADYDGSKMSAFLKLYEPESQKIFFFYDETRHLPYCLSDRSIDELSRNTELISYKGFHGFEQVKKIDLLRDEERVMTKVLAKDPLSIGRKIREILPEAWEANIKYHLNYLYDRQLIPCTLYSVKDGKLIKEEAPLEKHILDEISELFRNEEDEFKLAILRWMQILQQPIPKLRKASIDIEVYSPVATRLPDPSKAEYEVICASVVGSDGMKKVFILKRPGIEEGSSQLSSDVEVRYYEDERKLLIDLFKILQEYPFVLSFNGDEFDLNYLWHRALKLGFKREHIPIVMTRNFPLLKYGVHIDLCKFFFNRSIQVYAFGSRYREVTLDEVAKSMIGKGKMKIDKPISELSYSELASYCLRDAEITYELSSFDDELVMKLIFLISRIAVMPIEDSIRVGVTSWIKSFLFFEHRRRNALIVNPSELENLKHIPTTKPITKGKKYKGAIVVEPKPGIHFNTLVLDFASLYPSIIKKWNLSYETILCPHPECQENKVPGTVYWVCTRRSGISSLMIGSLKELRVKWYKPRSKDKNLPEKERRFYEVIQQALKLILNASYGAFGAEHFAFYVPLIADATATIGRYAMSKTIEKARSLGIEVIYGDTDSIFLKNPKKYQIDELMKWAKEELGLDLDIDKFYRYVVFSTLKKNYIGVYPDGAVDVKGLMGKKRHIPPFAREAFNEAIKVLGRATNPQEFEYAKKKIEEIVKKTYLKLKKKEYSLEDLAMHVMLGKTPDMYKSVTPQHVKAALLLLKRGVELKSGDIIEFVKTKTYPGVKPVQLASKEEIDIEGYVDYLKSAFKQLLDALDIDFSSLIAGFRKLDEFLS